MSVTCPVNDDKSPVDKRKRPWKARQEGSLPIGRSRRARGFPVAIPHDPTVYMVWQSTQLNEHREALESLANKVTHIGHSASLVRMWVDSDEEIAKSITLVPARGLASHRLRVFSPGRLDTLEQRYSMNLRPTPARWQGYEKPTPVESDDGPSSVFDPNLIGAWNQRKASSGYDYASAYAGVAEGH